MSGAQPTNGEVAEVLSRVADLLEEAGENPYRAGSYRRAARTVRSHDRSVADLLDAEGESTLQKLEGVGEKLAGAIREICETGRLGLLERLEAETDPVAVLSRVPGVAQELAGRIHSELDVSTLEELERAAHQGRLQEVEGISEKKAQGIRDALAGMLSRSAQRDVRQRAGGEEPPIELLLEIDQEYRDKAEAGELRRIAPRRFNPEGEAWLPIVETEREGWSFTVLFSNTARAHELGTTHDWVVIYYEDGGEEAQCTVVTSNRGQLEGRRVVRGREGECREHYGE
jgi:Holliday junction resolvasome RuvABC DNA-binding subunit